MIDIDRLSEAHYASDDPQFYDEEYEMHLKRIDILEELTNRIDDARSKAYEAQELSKSKRIQDVIMQLYQLHMSVEKEMEQEGLR